MKLIFGVISAILIISIFIGSTAYATNQHGPRILDVNKKCFFHKYEGKCDFIPPKDKITYPHMQQKLGMHIITVDGYAFDGQSGIFKVEVGMKDGPLHIVSTHDGNWHFTTPYLQHGYHTVKVVVTDKANNKTWDFVVWRTV